MKRLRTLQPQSPPEPAALEDTLRRRHGYSDEDIVFFSRLVSLVQERGIQGTTLDALKVRGFAIYSIT
jgi:hypothetical protein